MTEALMAAYNRLQIGFETGSGVWLYDGRGNRYLDALSGISVCNLGHCHPRISAALADQAKKLVHTSNLYEVPYQQQLADRLTALAGMDKVFFGNSGAEANEAAIKIIRLYGHQQGIATPEVVVMEGGFHGRTMATLSATANPKVQAGFEPLVPGFLRVPYDDVEAIKRLAEGCGNIAAVMLEPIQGEGGIVVPAEGYLRQLRQLCDERGWLLVLDEIQTGMCRTGHWFAYQREGIRPDVVTVAKALGNGLPIGACLARGPCATLIQPGKHGSTFGGSPLVCRVGLEVIETMQAEGLPERARVSGQRVLSRFRSRLSAEAGVNDVRGRGLMLGIELDRPCAELVGRALERHLLINVTAERVIRLLPPLIAEDEALDLMIDGVVETVSGFLHG